MKVDAFGKDPVRIPVQQGRDFAAIKSDIDLIYQLVMRLAAGEIEDYKSELEEMQAVVNNPDFPQLIAQVDALMALRQAVDPTQNETT